MRASAEKLHIGFKAAPAVVAKRRPRIALTSPLIAFSAAVLGSVAVWVGVFKLILG
ncbi:hypothetical protein [Brevundimonas goettingensis]|jgi:hypothetical protein|uniref:Uncharacterized protein n=1 Tax=Brevundimonas goettingensis TaxID=2774190 RepID=A0A975C3P3_9CAUL|nr:hypothetical protein [Brevundimonas goettingensis]QTC91290.1 hypothetical protein IFJ75_19180 [Brevundimonas goettingensis]